MADTMSASSSTSAATGKAPATEQPLPPAVICIGMAGSGKTTFMQRLNAHLHSAHEPPYIINLDPAVRTLPFSSNIDIRDSVNYRQVMSSYNLGPNGGIMTSLNLFATKIDQVVSILETRSKSHEISRILIDTPGQIECFVWSASGAILTDAIASTFPTVVAYVIDTPRTTSPATFMANMLYACSILYKTKLPMILVFNKTDAQDATFAKEWMTDFEAFQAALRESEDGNEEGVGGSGYMASLLNSMSLMLDEFYNHLDVVAVSAMTGQGIDEFFEAVQKKVVEYEKDYKPEMEMLRKKREDEKLEKKQKELDKLMKDMAVGDSGKKETPVVLSDVESDEDEPMYGDPSDEEEVDNDPDEGLKARYQKALQETSQNAMEDAKEYIRKSQG
ncbi:hypothetical protein EX30DRAFT_357261 [Ascodesmis nigricans]|uniref:GPN-loop GTPase n=1 Tax=Ascodesmis nigricans TaxID=341454 RepID=A0A4S2N885_9PEZI|nr:hypothetical protein EX30DRAFT_357261 [Ascodesmis nigricans]